jgi:ABC-2 type transport system ATP-binding protein
MRRKQAVQAAHRWLERLDLASRARSKVEELSKGMQQKLQFAGTLLHEPDIVILDEPFSGLDPLNQALFKEILLEFKQRDKAVLFSTHVMEQAEKLCDSICLVSRGRVVLTGDLDRIKRDLGANSYRLVARGDLSRIERIPFVEQCVEEDGFVKLMVEPGVEGSAVLRELVQFLDVREFRSQEPDLEEIFIKAVRNAA